MDSFDYVVVGAGSAGCVVARRLSDNPRMRVLLIEAGPPADSFWIHTPAGMARLFHNRRLNWSYTTEPEPGLNGRRVPWARGKTLGGSSAINGMIFMRGHPSNYDHWASLGNAGWTWNDVLPYFKRLENHERGESAYHGGHGPLRISDPVLQHPTSQAFVEAAVRIGIPRTHDLNAPPHEGVDFQQFNIRDGRRHSAYEAFVAPVRHRANLVVHTDMHVLRVLFDCDQACGIEVLHEGQRRTIACTREVIVSSGVVSSPHLLMLSGIGDAEQLQRHAITPKAHVPGVGRHLQDHIYAPYAIRSTHAASYNRSLRGLRKYWHGLHYLLKRRGYLALGSSAASAYVRSGPDASWPDLQLTMRPVSFQFLPSGALEVDRLPGVSAAVSLVHPRSVGHITLKSPDPLEPPRIAPCYLSDPSDVQRLVAGLRRMRQIFTAEPLASCRVSEIQPGADIASEEKLSAYVRAAATTAYHPVGTCRMGQDAMSVVDERLRVRGVQRLRVIDASIMPSITMGNTNAATIMIGEKGVEMVSQDAMPPRSVEC